MNGGDSIQDVALEECGAGQVGAVSPVGDAIRSNMDLITRALDDAGEFGRTVGLRLDVVAGAAGIRLKDYIILRSAGDLVLGAVLRLQNPARDIMVVEGAWRD